MNELAPSIDVQRNREARFRGILDELLEGCQLIGFDFRYLFVNAAAARHGRHAASEKIGRGVTEVDPEIVHTEIYPAMVATMTDRVPRRLETEYRYPDGSSAWFELHIQPQAEGIVVLSTDVTHRRREAAELRRTRSELAALVHASPVPISAMDRQGNVVLWNEAAQTLFGFRPEEIVGRSIAIVPEDARAHFEDVLRRTLESGGVRGELTVRTTKDGRRLPVSISSAALRDEDGTPTGLIAVITDLTEKTVMSNALAESEHRFAVAFEEGPVAMFIVRGDRVVEVNRACVDMFGSSRDEVLSRGSLGVDLAAHAHVFDAVARNEKVIDLPFTFEKPGGGVGDALATARRITLGGEPHILVVVQDVTARNAAERARVESEARLRQLTDTLDEALWLADPAQGKVLYVSPGYEKIWGRPREALYTEPRDWVLAIHEDDRERVHQALACIRTTGTFDEEYRVIRPDGTTRWVRDRAFPVKDEAGRVVSIAGSAEDVTSRRELEEQLRQAQKIESIGLLASGVAHDFNNVLTVIAGNTDALWEYLPDVRDAAVLLGEIRDAGDRAASLTRQLLAFSRREVTAPRVLDIDATIVDTEKMLRRILGEDVRFTITRSPAPCRVRIDPGSFVQVLMNLVVNARDAMPRGGKLSIATSRVVPDAAMLQKVRALAPRPYVVITVVDSGAGMTSEVCARVFEPFFTTKAVGRGTGLGLSVVHGIVAQAGGTVEVCSEVSIGTTFCIYLPLVDASVDVDDRARPTRATKGTETILFVEDDDAIRRIAVRALEKAGYIVLSALDGVHAEEVTRAHQGSIDLVVSDVVMPRMDGPELFSELRARYPHVRVLYASGYTDDALIHHGIRYAEVAFLPKPYDQAALLDRVREVLDLE